MGADPSQLIAAIATLVAALTGLLGAAVAAVVTLRRKTNGSKAIAEALAAALAEAKQREDA